MWRSRLLLVALAQKEFRVRYKRAAFGVLWSIAMPLLQAVVMVFVFSRVGRFGVGAHYSYAGFVVAGIVPWTYVTTSVLVATTSIVDASGLTDKVWFPRGILPLVGPSANLVTLGIAGFILLVLMPILGIPITLRLFLLIPAGLLTVLFTVGLGMLLGAMYPYFRDLKFMVQALLLVWLYVTPVVYPLARLGGAGKWFALNPLTGIVGLFQYASVGAPGPGWALVVSGGASVVLLGAAVAVLRRHDRLYVDVL